MTYNVFGGTLNLAQSINQSLHFVQWFFSCVCCINRYKYSRDVCSFKMYK